MEDNISSVSTYESVLMLVNWLAILTGTAQPQLVPYKSFSWIDLMLYIRSKLSKAALKLDILTFIKINPKYAN